MTKIRSKWQFVYGSTELIKQINNIYVGWIIKSPDLNTWSNLLCPKGNRIVKGSKYRETEVIDFKLDPGE